MALLDRLKPKDERIDAGVGFAVGPPRSGDARPELVAAPRLAPRADTLLQVGHDAVRDPGIGVRGSRARRRGRAWLAVGLLRHVQFPSLLAGSGPRHDPCPSARPGEPGEGCGRGRPGCKQAGRAATCAAERPCRPVGRVPWGEGAALPRRPAQRGMLANGRRRSARAIVTLKRRDRPRAPGGASAPSRARPALAGSPHTEDQDCSWPINRNRPHLDVLVFAPEMLVRPQRAPGAGDD